MRIRLHATLLLGSVTIAGTFAMTVPTTAAEGPSDKACPADPSGFVEASLRPLGSPVPGPGEDLLWDLRVAGFAAEGLTLDDAAALFGFDSVQELYDYSITTGQQTDNDGNGEICVNLKNLARASRLRDPARRRPCVDKRGSLGRRPLGGSVHPDRPSSSTGEGAARSTGARVRIRSCR
jgi:hypothetical protein